MDNQLMILNFIKNAIKGKLGDARCTCDEYKYISNNSKTIPADIRQHKATQSIMQEIREKEGGLRQRYRSLTKEKIKEIALERTYAGMEETDKEIMSLKDIPQRNWPKEKQDKFFLLVKRHFDAIQLEQEEEVNKSLALLQILNLVESGDEIVIEYGDDDEVQVLKNRINKKRRLKKRPTLDDVSKYFDTNRERSRKKIDCWRRIFIDMSCFSFFYRDKRYR